MEVKKRQIDFSSIIDWGSLYRVTPNIDKYDPRSIVYAMPKDLLLVLDEQLSLLNYNTVDYSQADLDTFYSVVPISYDEYSRLMSKPYKYPPKNQAWRLITKKRQISVEVPIHNSYQTVHTSQTAYAYVKGTKKAVFTIEFDSYDDNDTKICIAFVGPDYDSEDIQDLIDNGYTVKQLNSTEMSSSIKEVLDTWSSNQSLNNLKITIMKGFEYTNWSTLWSGDKLFIDIQNPGSQETAEVAPVIASRGDTPPDTPAGVLETRQLVEIIGKFPSVPYYRMRYVRKPKPIILEPRLDLLGVSIDGIGYGDAHAINNEYTYDIDNPNPSDLSTFSECELPEELHHEILERAVTLAKIAWQGGTMTQAALAAQATR